MASKDLRVLRSPHPQSGVATGGMGANAPPTFCQDGTQDFFKINEPIIGGADSGKSSEK